MNRQSFIAAAKITLVCLIVYFLGTIFVKHWNEIKLLAQFDAYTIFLMYMLTFIACFVVGQANKILLNSLGIRTTLIEMTHLYNAVTLLNYIPLKFGTLFRANYLKKHHALNYTAFGAFFLYQTIIMVFIISVTAIITLLSLYNSPYKQTFILLAFFLASLIISFFLLFVNIPYLKEKNKFSKSINSCLKARNTFKDDKKTLCLYTLLMTFNFLLGATRLFLIYKGLGQNINPFNFLIMGATGYFSMFLGLTPGGLGVRELILGATAAVIGVPLKIGIPAAIFDRAIAMTFSFTIGGISSALLWRKNPEDFKQLNNKDLK